MNRLLKKSFLLCCVILTGIELVLRLALPPGFRGNFEYGYNPDQGFTENAGGMVTITPNIARDFHAQSFSKTPAQGRRRIIALGDSVEYWSGSGVHVLADTYPVRISAELRTNGIDCETLNLAVTGYGSLRNQLLLKKILSYRPDVVLLKLNSVNEGTDESNLHHAGEFRTWRAMNWPRRSYLVQSLLIIKENWLMRPLLANDIIVQSLQNPAEAKKKSPGEPDASKNLRFVETVTQSVQILSSNRVPVILVCQSFLKKSADGKASLSDDGLEKVAYGLKGPGVEVFSMSDTLRDMPDEKIFIDHVHMTPMGHQVTAHALTEKVRQVLGR
jgi:lysophospholipase L1-like esterase